MTTKDEHLAITKYDLLYEQRMTRVEAAVESLDKNTQEIKSEFRLLLGIMLGGFSGLFAMMIGLFGLMAHGFKWF